jgi:hypothetical protein
MFFFFFFFFLAEESVERMKTTPFDFFDFLILVRTSKHILLVFFVCGTVVTHCGHIMCGVFSQKSFVCQLKVLDPTPK